MPLDALPEHLQDIENNFPDDDQYSNIPILGKMYRYFNKTTKTWFAFSYRCKNRLFRWRKYPKLLLGIGGQGVWRWEPVIPHTPEIYDRNNNPLSGGQPSFYYLSRIQYYKRWHFAIQWPLIISFHAYFRNEDVPVYGKERPDTDGKLFFFYWNHYDADLVYWMLTSIFIGLGWK